MSYRHFSAEDFFHDTNFRKWVLEPDPKLNFFWEKWLLNHPDKKEEMSLARKMVKSIQIDEHEWTETGKEELWQRILQANQALIKSGEVETKIINLPIGPNNNRSKSKGRNFKYGWLKAAVVSGLILAGIYFLSNESETLPDEPVISMVEKQNPKGQKSKIFLPDGSVAHLNSNSRLVYPEHFQEGQRLVELSGEAFFEVVGDSLNPFVVESNQLVTKVLGTSFNVKDYPEQQNVEVSLIQGKLKVKLKENEQEILLYPGESAVSDANSNKLNTGKFDYLANVAWKDGILFFNETSLDQAFTTLVQWYGVNFSFNTPPTPQIKVTGKFENAYLTNVLKSLSYSVSFDYEIKNGTDVNIKFY